MASPDIAAAAGSGGPISLSDVSAQNNNGQLQNIPALPPLIRIDSIRKRSSEAEKNLSAESPELMKLNEEDTPNPIWIGAAPTLARTGIDGNQASDSEIENAVLQVVQVFSKPEPDRQRLFRAVISAVKGETTIKEAATQYYFATSTMHPYVHRARELLGDRAPPMKSNRTGIVLNTRGPRHVKVKEGPKIPAHLQKLKPLSTNVSEFLRNSFSMPAFTNSETFKLRMPTACGYSAADSELSTHLPIESLPVESSFEAGDKILGNGRLSEGSSADNSLMGSEEDMMTSQDRLQTDNSYFDSTTDDNLPIEQGNASLSDFSTASAEEEVNSLKIPKLEGSFGQVETPEDAAREVIQNSDVSETASMGLFLALVRCLNKEVSPREAALSLGMPVSSVSSMVERAKLLLPVSELDYELLQRQNGSSDEQFSMEDVVDKAIRGSHYYGQSKERLHQAVLQTIRGDLPLTQAAAAHCVPFSTLHPYVKRARLLMAHPEQSFSSFNESSFLDGDSSTMTKNDFKKTAVPGIVASGSTPSGFSKVTSIALGQIASKFAGNGLHTKPRTSAGSAKSSTGSGRGKFQDGMPELSKLPPEVVRMAVDRAVQSCQYDNPQKKQRLSAAVLEALSGNKTMKAAAAMHEVPFTTLQTYFHRSKAQIQREASNLRSGDGSGAIISTEKYESGEFSSGAQASDILRASLMSESNGQRDLSEREIYTLDVDPREEKKPRKRPWSNAESLWSKLKERQDKAQEEMDIRVEEALSRHSTPKSDTAEMRMEEDLEPFLNDDTATTEQPIVADIKIEPAEISSVDQKPLFCSSVETSVPESSGSSRRKPKKVIRNSAVSIPSEKCPSTSASSPLMTEENDLNSVWLKGDDDKFFGAPQAQEVDDLLTQFWQSLEGSVDIVQPMAPEDVDLDEMRESDPAKQRPSRNMAEIRRQDEEKLAELLKAASHQEFDLGVQEAVHRATENSQYDGEQRDRLKQAALVSVRGDCSMKEAARNFDIPLGTLHTYFHRARNLVEAAKHGLDPDNPDVVSLVNRLGAAGIQIGAGKKPKKREKSLAMQKWEKEIETMEELQDLDSEGGEISQEKLERVVERVIKNSLYPPEQKERLLNAVARVISGELTINAAANIYHLPSSTVHPYVHRARAALGKLCPPQAKLTPIAKVAKSPKLQATLAKLQKHFQSTSVAQNAANKAKQNAMAMMRNTAMAKSQQKEYGSVAVPDDEEDASNQTVSSDQFSNGVNFEDADRVVTDLVKTSLYGDEGRQRLYEAILMVITDSANVSEAARTYQIPPSTIQPYVARAKAALNLAVPSSPLTGSGSNSPAPGSKTTPKGRTTIPAPKIFAAPGNGASDDEVSEVVEKVVRNSVNADDRRERLYKAVFAAVSGKSTIKDACTLHTLPASTVHPYVSRARHMLGDRCPPPKIATISGSPAANFHKSVCQNIESPKPNEVASNSNSNQKNSPTLIVLSGTSEKENAGRKMLELQLKQILGRYNYRGDRDRLVLAISTVIGEKKTLAQVSELTGIAQTTLSTYVRIARMFVKESGFYVDEMEGEGMVSKSEPGGFVLPTESFQAGSDEMAGNIPGAGVMNSEVKGEPERTETVLQSPVVQMPTANRRKPLQNAVSELLKLDGATEQDKERKIQAAIQHSVSVQYKQNQQAKRQLMDAIEDVMLRGIDITEAIGENQGVITQFVIEKFIDRVEKGVNILEEPLSDLYAKAASVPEEKEGSESGETPPTKRARKSSGVESVHDALSPTRTSRRLQEKQKVEAEAEAKFPAPLEKHLVEFLKKLETINFPMTSEMVLTIANQMLKEHRMGTEEKLNQAWIDKLKQKYAVLNIGR